MNVQIKLYRKNWYSGSAIHCIGWVSKSGRCYSGKALLCLLETLIDTETFDMDKACKLTQDFNGSYAILVVCFQKMYLISDRTRSYPLVYTNVSGTTFVTDNLLTMVEECHLELSIDICQAELFLVSGLTFEEHTIYKGVYGLQAAEIVQLSIQKEPVRERYFFYKLNTTSKPYLTVEEEIIKQNTIFTHVFQRMLESAPDVHNWIIPLSGGHDSRMVAYQLYKLGIRNVICYSYGGKNNCQAQLSKQVADRLGYKWYFVEYNPTKWYELRQNPIFNRYFDFAFNGISDPHIQDLLAVYELHRLGIFSSRDYFVPGHTFDFITGSQCLDGIKNIKSEKEAAFYLRYFQNQWICRPRSKNVRDLLTEEMRRAKVPLNIFTEYFLWQEWHCKFLLNSVRVYELFGYDWRTPLWDQELVDYWQSLHVDYKLYRNFLYQCEQKGLYDEPLHSVPFDFHITAQSHYMKIMHRLVPYDLVRKYKYYFHPQVKHADDGLYNVYAYHLPVIEDIIPYHLFPEELRYYLEPYRKRPLCWSPDNDVNSMYALRNQFG